MDRMMLYDLMYALAARNGREESLFGGGAQLAHEAFAQSLVGEAFPEVWFEVPLLGDPWFDLHVLTDRKTISIDQAREALVPAGAKEAFAWFAGASGVRQLALSYDVSSGRIEQPAVQLLVSDPARSEDFLRIVGGEQAVDSYRRFAKRIPQEWFPCYTGVFDGRDAARQSDSGTAAAAPQWVRVECIVGDRLQRAYVQDASLLQKHLEQAGLSDVDKSIVPRCQLLADSPFKLEFQFNVMPDGRAGETFSASIRYASAQGSDAWMPFDTDGPCAAIMEKAESWGLVDGRWRMLADTAFAVRANKGGQGILVYCFPAFLKLRWRKGEPQDAKAYLMGGVQC